MEAYEDNRIQSTARAAWILTRQVFGCGDGVVV